MGKQSQLLLKPTEVELGLQVGVEFAKNVDYFEIRRMEVDGWDLKTHMDGIYIQEHPDVYPDVE